MLLIGEHRADFWVCGRFEVRDGQIVHWCDYFGTGNFLRALLPRPPAGRARQGPRPLRSACDDGAVAMAPKRIRLSEPGVAGCYELVEQRADGSLLLRPEAERLSEVLRETEGRVFRDDEFAAHLERVAASEDDLPREDSQQPCRHSSGCRGSTASSVGCRESFSERSSRCSPRSSRRCGRRHRRSLLGCASSGCRAAPGVWEVTFASDGRATFAYGDEVVAGEPHVIWRRVGTHDVLGDP